MYVCVYEFMCVYNHVHKYVPFSCLHGLKSSCVVFNELSIDLNVDVSLSTSCCLIDVSQEMCFHITQRVQEQEQKIICVIHIF